MEIHAPDGPIESWKDTIKHLAIITAGVLIALALEGIVSWGDHRLLVREARANLTAELRSNRQELAGLFANLAQESKELQHVDDIVVVLLAHKPLEHAEFGLHSHDVELKNAAVTTGQITGAFGYMEYSDVRRYADIYDLQAQFMRLQERDEQNFTEAFGFVRRIAGPTPPSTADLEEFRRRIDSALAGVFYREQMGRQLLKRYDEILSVK